MWEVRGGGSRRTPVHSSCLSPWLSLPHHLSGRPSRLLSLSLATFPRGWGAEGRKGRHEAVTAGLMGWSCGSREPAQSGPHTPPPPCKLVQTCLTPLAAGPKADFGGGKGRHLCPSQVPLTDKGNQHCLHSHKGPVCSGARRPVRVEVYSTSSAERPTRVWIPAPLFTP